MAVATVMEEHSPGCEARVTQARDHSGGGGVRTGGRTWADAPWNWRRGTGKVSVRDFQGKELRSVTAVKKVGGFLGLFREERTLPVTGIAMAQDGTLFYTADDGNEGVLFREGEDPVPAGNRPMTPTLSPDGKYVYVCDRFGAKVRKFDAKTLECLAEAPAVREANGCALGKDGKLLFVINMLPDDAAEPVKYVAARVTVIDTATFKVLDSPPQGPLAHLRPRYVHPPPALRLLLLPPLQGRLRQGARPRRPRLGRFPPHAGRRRRQHRRRRRPRRLRLLQGRSDDAIEIVGDIPAGTEAAFDAQLVAAGACLTQNRPDEAMRHLEKAAKARPKDPRPYFNMAVAFLRMPTADPDRSIAAKFYVKSVELGGKRSLTLERRLNME